MPADPLADFDLRQRLAALLMFFNVFFFNVFGRHGLSG
jgi:hypothetical protein